MSTTVKKYEVLQDLFSFFREGSCKISPEISEALRDLGEILLKLKVPALQISTNIAREKIPVSAVDKYLGGYLDQIDEQRKKVLLVHQRMPEFFPTISQLVLHSEKLIDLFPYVSTVTSPNFGGHLYSDDFGVGYLYAINEESLSGLLQNLANIFTKKEANQPEEPIEEGVEILVRLANVIGRIPDNIAPNMLFKKPPSIVEELKSCLKQVREEFGPHADLYQSHFLDELMVEARQSYDKLKYEGQFKGNESSIGLRDFSGMEIKKNYLGLAKLSQFLKKWFPKQ